MKISKKIGILWHIVKENAKIRCNLVVDSFCKRVYKWAVKKYDTKDTYRRYLYDQWRYTRKDLLYFLADVERHAAWCRLEAKRNRSHFMEALRY